MQWAPVAACVSYEPRYMQRWIVPWCNGYYDTQLAIQRPLVRSPGFAVQTMLESFLIPLPQPTRHRKRDATAESVTFFHDVFRTSVEEEAKIGLKGAHLLEISFS